VSVPSTVDQPPVAEKRAARPAAIAPWLVLCCYLLAAVAVTARLWADPASRAQVGDPHDVDLFAWYMRYAATAVSHGRLPALVTTALNPPQGVSVMWNTSFLLPGMLLTPVTLLAGPQTSLTVALTLAMAGSAAALFWLLRRWQAGLPAAALGGAVYGFSPAVINSGIGHYHVAFAVLPPLIIDALLRILTGRGNVVRYGAWLGLLAGAQVFIGEELLADTAVACLVLAGALALTRPRTALSRARAVALGLAAAAVVALLISGHALWVQLHGPLTEHPALLGTWSSNPAFFVDPGGNLLIHTRAGAAAVASFHLGPAEVVSYLGWPLLAVLALAMISFWRDLRVGNTGHTMAMRWQADTGEPGSMVGGYFIGPAPGTGLPVFDAGPTKQTTKYLDWIWDGSRRARPSFMNQMRADLAYWHPAAVVAVTSPGAPTGRLLTELLGKPSLRAGSVLAWRR